MAEARDVPSERAKPDRRQELSQRPREQKRQRIALGFIIFFLLVIAGFAVTFYAKVFVLPGRQLVVKVDDVKYTRGDMAKLLQARQRQHELIGFEFKTGEEVFKALQIIVENEIISQSAPRFGITVTEEEVDFEIKLLFLLAPGADQEKLLSSQAEREYQERYREYLNTLQLSESEFRETLRKQRLREKFRQFIGENVPTVVEQVHLHRLVVSQTDEIDIMQVKFKDAVGVDTDPEHLQEAFKQIAREFSRDDREIIRKGGDLNWVPRGIFTKYDYNFFDLEVGELSEPTPNIDNTEEIFFYMISERSEAREISPADREILKTNALQDWLNDERSNHDVFAEFTSDIYHWLIEELQLTRSTTPTPRPNPLGL